MHVYLYIYMCVCVYVLYLYVRGKFNKFPEFFVQASKIVDSWKFSMLLLYILWDDWPIFMILGWNFLVQMNSYSRNWNTPY